LRWLAFSTIPRRGSRGGTARPAHIGRLRGILAGLPGSATQREARTVDVLALWLDRPLASDCQGEAVLLDVQGLPMEERVRRPLKARDNRPVMTQE
jgi:hypothetical protein